MNQVPDSSARRIFISNMLKAAGASLILAPIACGAGQPKTGSKALTVQDIIDLIIKDIPGAPFSQTVDTIKSGRGDQQVTGIVSTMFATIKIIEEAARRNANFIIAHEPTFYNHTDDKNWVSNNAVVKQKQELLEKHKIAVWRFHDYWHTVRPDGILYGVLKKAGWTSYYKEGSRILTIPPMSLQNLAEHFKKSLGITRVKVIGNLSQSCQRIGLIPGAAGGQTQVRLVESDHPDVLVVGEVHEWETAEYIRDTQAMGGKTSLIILGHSVSEEPGMNWLVDWLQPKIPNIPVTHIGSGDPFTWL
jgi:putative NIF3 family GTP cyclohydrolase 1 type 2